MTLGRRGQDRGYLQGVTSTVPEYIIDATRYKLIIIEKGRIGITSGEVTLDAQAPSIILLSLKDKIRVKIIKPLKLKILYILPRYSGRHTASHLLNSEKPDVVQVLLHRM